MLYNLSSYVLNCSPINKLKCKNDRYFLLLLLLLLLLLSYKCIAWSKKSLISAWIEDPVKCCEKCGISGSVIEAMKNNKIQETSQSSENSSKKNITTLHSVPSDSLNNNSNKCSKATKIEPNGHVTSATENANDPSVLSNENSKMVQILELNLSSVIARKLSGRFMQLKKKEGSCSSFESSANDQTTAANNSAVDSTFKRGAEADSNLKKNGKEQINPSYVDSCSQNIDLTRCGICFNNFSESETKATTHQASDDGENISQEDIVQILCGHKFCKICCEQ